MADSPSQTPELADRLVSGWMTPFSDTTLRVAVSNAHDGNLSRRYGNHAAVRQARQAWWRRLGVDPAVVVVLSLDASYGVHWMAGETMAHGMGESIKSDGAWIEAGKRALFMVVGDCYPVVCFDPMLNFLGLFHAGRYDLGAGLLEKFLALGREHGVDPSQLRVFIGPGICPQHYIFYEAPSSYARLVAQNGDGLFHVDLRRDIRETLARAGVEAAHMAEDIRCTYESSDLFSHRRTKGVNERRFGVIAYA